MRAAISPSLMCMDFLKVKEQMLTMNQWADYYHADIMDGHFCKNITLSPDMVKAFAEGAQTAGHEIKEFNDMIRCIIQLSSLIAACSNDCKVKLFSIGIRNYKVIKENNGKLVLCGIAKLLENMNKIKVNDYVYEINDIDEAYKLVEEK